MKRQKMGMVMFWTGVASIILWQALTWLHHPTLRAHTAEELRGTLYAVDGLVGFFRYTVLGGLGLALPVVGVLLYTSEKGSYFWLWGFLGSSLTGIGMMWEPAQHMPPLFGLGGTVILLSYLGILWAWTRTYAAFEGVARTGKQVQLLGYTALYATGALLCSYVGDPNLLALADLPTASAESVNMSLALSMLLLALGHYLATRSKREASPRILIPRPGGGD